MSEGTGNNDNGDVTCEVDFKRCLFPSSPDAWQAEAPDTYQHLVAGIDGGELEEYGCAIIIDSQPGTEFRTGNVEIRHDKVVVRLYDHWDEIVSLAVAMNADSTWVMERVPVHEHGNGISLFEEFETPKTALDLIVKLNLLDAVLEERARTAWQAMKDERKNMAITAMREAVEK